MSDVFYKRNLAVPFFTQRDNTYVWQQLDEENKPFGLKYPMAWRTCNITSLCMILNYFNLTKETPNQMIKKVFEKAKENNKWGWLYEANNDSSLLGASRLENWDNLVDVAKLYTDGKEGYTVTRGNSLSMEILQQEIAKGFPVMISTGLGKLISNNSYAQDGHIVVVRGFTDEGHVILNDPFGIPVNENNRIHKKTENGSMAGYYYNSEASSIGDNIVIHRDDFVNVYAVNSSRFLYIEGPLWEMPGGTETDVVNCYPIRADNMWHDGIHLENTNGFYSIGSGRLVAARNSEVENHGSNSFALVKYQLPDVDKKYFYALYMHLEKIDIKQELKDFFLKNNGNVSEQLRGTWYEQLFNGVLAKYKIINWEFLETATEAKYKKIYKAKINNYVLSPISEFSNSFNGEGLISKHAKLYLLPASPNNLKKICDIESYSSYSNIKFMASENLEDFKDANGYYYFFCGNNGQKELCCCKNDTIKVGNNDISVFASYFKTNAGAHKYYSEALYDLYKGQTISFDKINNTNKLIMEDQLKREVFSSNCIFKRNVSIENNKIRLQCPTGPDYSYPEHSYTYTKFETEKVIKAIKEKFYITANTTKFKKSEDFNNYINSLKNERKSMIETLLKKISSRIDSIEINESDNALSDKEWMVKIFKDAEQKIKLKELYNISGNYNIDDSYDAIRKVFFDSLDKFKHSDLCTGIAICEYLFIVFVSIPSDMIKNAKNDRFEFGGFNNTGSTITKILEYWTSFYNELKNDYSNFLHESYFDNYIEIPKHSFIGYGSNIPDSTKKDSIHFEVFSEDNLLPDFICVKDDNNDNFYNSSAITDDILSKIPEEDKTRLFQYFEDGVITKSEIQNVYTNTELFKKMVTYHRSEWKYQNYNAQDCKFITSKNITLPIKKEIIDTLSYYNDYYGRYNWLDNKIKRILGSDIFYYYHPVQFIKEQMNKS